MKTYYVYIMTNRSRTLYTGVTNDLQRRVMEHKSAARPGFTAKYRMTELAYYESTEDVYDALSREKQIKGWTRRRKVELIDGMNPFWFDLSDSFAGASSFTEPDPSLRSG
ncbi:MAG TPA: GIY-YIG nuclease family protein [Dehalococcoidia bacterium]|nr:GIY-YIG nuclease family protein [Dehalococcoidia bacterium]